MKTHKDPIQMKTQSGPAIPNQVRTMAERTCMSLRLWSTPKHRRAHEEEHVESALRSTNGPPPDLVPRVVGFKAIVNHFPFSERSSTRPGAAGGRRIEYRMLLVSVSKTNSFTCEQSKRPVTVSKEIVFTTTKTSYQTESLSEN
jgi:hypothetical protein